MSGYIKPDTIQAIAHSVDIPKLTPEAAKALAPDVEYRMREVVQVRVEVVALSPRLAWWWLCRALEAAAAVACAAAVGRAQRSVYAARSENTARRRRSSLRATRSGSS